MLETFIQADDRIASQTAVLATVQLETDIAVALRDDIVRPAKGGQPQDQASVVIGNRPFVVGPIFRMSGMTWLTLKSSHGLSLPQDEVVEVWIDASRRMTLARSHTLSHLLMAAASRVVEDFVGEGTEIDETGTCVTALFQTSSKLDSLALNMIDCITRHLICRDVVVSVSSAMSSSEGASHFRHWRQDRAVGETGPFPVVEIAGVDATPCDGSHVASTGAVGPYRLRHDVVKEGDIYRLTAERTPTWMYWFGEQALIDFDWNALHMKRVPKAS